MQVSQSKFHVKKGDNVAVIAGKDKGKTGEVLKVLRRENRVVVKGVNLLTKHTKQTPTSEGGIVREEGTIHISNVMHIDPTDKKPTRIGYKIEGDKKVRVAKRSGQSIDL